MTQLSARTLARQIVPAVAVGMGSALVLLLVDWLAEHWLHHLLWTDNPSRWHIFAVLTGTGIAVGLVVWLMPGHAGPHPATLELIHAPEPVSIVPSLLLAAILGLAGGVSLGPEFPVLGANAALAVAIGARVLPKVNASAWNGLAAAGTIGALFGSPIAAALMLTEVMAGQQRAERVDVWDRLFAPLAAAAAGGLTVMALSHGSSFSVNLPAYPGFRGPDLFTGPLIACAAVVVGLAATWLFPLLYQAFRRLRHPALMLTAGGVLLGLLGALGGPLTLFKGLDQMKELSETYASHSAANLAALSGIKVLALLIAATAGFRGGRIFPAAFAGVAFGLFAHAVIPSVPVSLAVACGVLGLLMAITRSGWMSILLAAVLVPDRVVAMIVIISVLPAWLLITGRQQMIAAPEPAHA